MQRILFHKIHDIKNKLLIIIHADKNECSKREKFLPGRATGLFTDARVRNKNTGLNLYYFYSLYFMLFS
jgi:hypothetical protein